jgi:hypothetical protein
VWNAKVGRRRRQGEKGQDDDDDNKEAEEKEDDEGKRDGRMERMRRERNKEVGGIGRREIRVTDEEQAQTATKAKEDGNLGQKESEQGGADVWVWHGRAGWLACFLLLRIHCPVLSHLWFFVWLGPGPIIT